MLDSVFIFFLMWAAVCVAVCLLAVAGYVLIQFVEALLVFLESLRTRR